MDVCDLIDTCPFFLQEMTYLPATQNLMMKNYCRGAYSACARYMVYLVLGVDGVPSDLYPNEHKKAQEIVSGS